MYLKCGKEQTSLFGFKKASSYGYASLELDKVNAEQLWKNGKLTNLKEANLKRNKLDTVLTVVTVRAVKL